MRWPALLAVALLIGCTPTERTIAACEWEVAKVPKRGTLFEDFALTLDCMKAQGYELAPGGFGRIGEPIAWQSTNRLARAWRQWTGAERNQ